MFPTNGSVNFFKSSELIPFSFNNSINFSSISGVALTIVSDGEDEEDGAEPKTPSVLDTCKWL